ncbi:hypothetical protein Bca4012_061555 [Brassica carinata]
MFCNNESSTSWDRTHSTPRLLQFLDTPPRVMRFMFLVNEIDRGVVFGDKNEDEMLSVWDCTSEHVLNRFCYVL